MPTILRQSGFSLIIYTKDHEPMHVHAWHQGNEAIIEFENGVSLRENNGMNRTQIKRAMRIVTQNSELLIEKRREICG
jgi:hypothetical protein